MSAGATYVQGWPQHFAGNLNKYWGANGEGGRSTYWPREADPAAVGGDTDKAQRPSMSDSKPIAIVSCHMWRSILGHDAKGVNVLYLDGSVSWMPNFEIGGGTILGVNGLAGNGFGGAPGWGDGWWLTLFKDFMDSYHGK
jgi:prepilin-type processing-associated H-X9-DG protein